MWLVVAFTVTAVAWLGLTATPAFAAKDDCADVSSGGINLDLGKCVPAKKAKLRNGKAIAPATAPERVKKVIEWANRIRNKPYRYGGGHGSFEDSGYDCSGAVSYALRGGRFVTSPLPSTGYFSWGKRGAGKWITVYTDHHHAYMVVAGLRFDTSMTPGDGPGWSKSLRSTAGNYKARSPKGY